MYFRAPCGIGGADKMADIETTSFMNDPVLPPGLTSPYHKSSHARFIICFLSRDVRAFVTPLFSISFMIKLVLALYF